MAFPASLNVLMNATYVVFAFISALCLGAIKGIIVGPIAALLLILGNVGVILGLFPAHVVWTVYTLLKMQIFDLPMKVAILLVLPGLFVLWLGLGVGGSVIVGVGYGFFTPCIATFEAFRHDHDSKKFLHCIVDGTWGTINGSWIVVIDFVDVCYHSYPSYLKELREKPCSDEHERLRLVHVPGCIVVGIIGLIVEVPLFTTLAIAKSPYLLFKGWFRLVHDLISREGPFLETACVPILGLLIFVWPLVVIASILVAIFSSIIVGLKASIIVYQERSFRRGLAYVIAMVAEFDEYTNEWLYLREGTFFPKPQYRKNKDAQSTEFSVRGNSSVDGSRLNTPTEAPAMLVPNLANSRSVRQTIQEVKMVQIWGNMMKSVEMRGKDLLDSNILTAADLYEWLKGKNSDLAAIVGVGLPCYSLLQTLIFSIKSNSSGVLLSDGFEINYLNRPKDKLLDWFFNPVMVLKEQIRVNKLEESEVRYLEKVLLFGSDTQRMQACDNDNYVLQDAVRAAQIQGLARRMIGMVRSVSKLPTYRRKFKQVVKALVTHSIDNDISGRSGRSIISEASDENV
ncbi:hypothetical protein Lal_00007578 [Lupinus albus]|uniref:Uncharacterized protein n=1 Tax=Lupinus albus TaxID=3870 RepID=A0A6A5MVZ2_LUPAL|nr:hypothetical protein Lalb_Chr16g0378481 [Lupinus albus]KAF1874962.1 hypothetical protein Lal_00007578 [Lupinus albus]